MFMKFVYILYGFYLREFMFVEFAYILYGSKQNESVSLLFSQLNPLYHK